MESGHATAISFLHLALLRKPGRDAGLPPPGYSPGGDVIEATVLRFVKSGSGVLEGPAAFARISLAWTGETVVLLILFPFSTGDWAMNRRLSKLWWAFTLIELLVVIAIIGILAALILPALTRVKRHSKVTVCLNNLHQLGIGMEFYFQDTHKFPWFGPPGGFEIAPEFACGLSDADRHAEMKHRALYPYIKPSEVFHCPEDKGKDFLPVGPNYAPSLFYAFGCSYEYNNAPRWKTRQNPEGPLAGQLTTWVDQPALYIMFFEPPACPAGNLISVPPRSPCPPRWPPPPEYPHHFFHWHFRTGRPTELDLGQDSQKFISPILFVEGHAAKHDFTRAIKRDPSYFQEPTKDWIWYQPLTGGTNHVITQ